MASFGERLREARNKKGWNQQDLAQKAGLKQASISQFEKGLRRPTPANTKKMAELLGVPVDYLIGEGDGDFGRARLMRNVKGMSPATIEKLNELVEAIRRDQTSRSRGRT